MIHNDFSKQLIIKLINKMLCIICIPDQCHNIILIDHCSVEYHCGQRDNVMVIVWLLGNNWLITIATIMGHTIYLYNNHFI